MWDSRLVLFFLGIIELNVWKFFKICCRLDLIFGNLFGEYNNGYIYKNFVVKIFNKINIVCSSIKLEVIECLIIRVWLSKLRYIYRKKCCVIIKNII